VNTQEVLLTALQQRTMNYQAQRNRCQEAFSEAAVHDLRVSTRRLLALIDLMHAIEPQARLQKVRRSFKNQLNSLDGLRDTQVMLAEIDTTIEKLPELAPFQKHLLKRERQFLQAANRDVRNFKTGNISQSLDKVFQRLALPVDIDDLTSRLLTTLDNTYLTVSQRQGQVEPSQPATIHSVRIAFKKFRYMIEIAHPILPNFSETQFKGMREYQTTMGRIQDAEVFLRSLVDFSSSHKSCNLQTARTFYEGRHTELIGAYMESRQELTHFWRKTPKDAFPWEKNS
jgi:CHAD domain-containing protein